VRVWKSRRMPSSRIIAGEPLRKRATRFGAVQRLLGQLAQRLAVSEEVAESVAKGAAELFKGRAPARD
jgi:hypothetical protein